MRALAHVVRLKERLVGSKPPLTSEILKLAPRYFWFSSRKAEDELGYEVHSVDPGIEAAWEWMKSGGRTAGAEAPTDDAAAGKPAGQATNGR